MRPAYTPPVKEAEQPPFKPRPKKKKSSRRYDEERSGGIAINRAIVVGLLMMLGAVVWLVLGLMAGRLFFYPPVLFVLGNVSIVRGFTGND